MKDSKELLGKMGKCHDLGAFIQKAKYIMENVHSFHNELEVLRKYLELHEKDNLNILEKTKKGRLKRQLVKFFSELEIPPAAQFAV